MNQKPELTEMRQDGFLINIPTGGDMTYTCSGCGINMCFPRTPDHMRCPYCLKKGGLRRD